jgi:hypothetical protein
MPPQGYPPPGPPGPAGYPVQTSVHVLAVISLVAGIVLCIPGSGLAAIICGFIARSAIAREPGRYGGSGMALAGIILGFVHIAGWLLYVILAVVLGVAGAMSH